MQLQLPALLVQLQQQISHAVPQLLKQLFINQPIYNLIHIMQIYKINIGN